MDKTVLKAPENRNVQYLFKVYVKDILKDWNTLTGLTCQDGAQWEKEWDEI